MIDNDTIVSWIEAGLFVSCTDMMAGSTGNMAKFFADDGQLKFAKAAATYTDGDWYYVFMTNDTARSIQLTESDGPLRAVIQVHGAYDVMIRQDWLDKLSLALPTTEESQVMADYGNDLKTYLIEVATKLVTGEYAVGDIQSFIDHANDALHLQEYIDAQQGRVDRFMNAMGLK